MGEPSGFDLPEDLKNPQTKNMLTWLTEFREIS